MLAQSPDNMPLADARVVRATDRAAYVVRAETGASESLVVDTMVYEGDRLYAMNGIVVLSFSNGSNLVMQRGSDLYIDTLRQEDYDERQGAYGALASDPSRSYTKVFLSEGEVLGHTKRLRADSVFQVETPVGTAGIRGTRFRVGVTMVGNQIVMSLANFDGTVILERTLTLDTGEFIVDELQLVDGETVDYLVDIDPETDEFRADPEASLVRAVMSAAQRQQGQSSIDNADNAAQQSQQNNPVPPPSTRDPRTPPPPPPGAPAPRQVNTPRPPVPPPPPDTDPDLPLDEDDGPVEEEYEIPDFEDPSPRASN